MKDLEKEQREMRDRMKRQVAKSEVEKTRSANPKRTQMSGKVEVESSEDIDKLQERIAALEEENKQLLALNEQLRTQKTRYVETERSKGADERKREQAHNYFKYSNARRW